MAAPWSCTPRNRRRAASPTTSSVTGTTRWSSAGEVKRSSTSASESSPRVTTVRGKEAPPAPHTQCSITIGCSTTIPAGTEMNVAPVRKASFSTVKGSALPSAQAPRASGASARSAMLVTTSPLEAYVSSRSIPTTVPFRTRTVAARSTVGPRNVPSPSAVAGR